MMKIGNITNRAICVVRVCGEKLNAERVPIYKTVARQCIEMHPVNMHSNQQQVLPNEEEINKYYEEKRTNRRGRSGRGRGERGRGRGAGTYTAKSYSEAANPNTAYYAYRGGRARGGGGKGRDMNNGRDTSKNIQYIPKSYQDYHTSMSQEASPWYSSTQNEEKDETVD